MSTAISPQPRNIPQARTAADINQLGAKALREVRSRRIGKVFQHFGLLPHRTVRDNVALPLELRKEPGHLRHAAADAQLQAVGLWLSFTLSDSPENGPSLRSGESAAQAVRLALELGVQAVLFDCSQPGGMGRAVIVARQVINDAGGDVDVGVYANAFPVVSEKAEANATLLEIRQDLGPDAYLRWARRWVEQGASIADGRCGIGPEHISRLHSDLLPAANATLSQGNG